MTLGPFPRPGGSGGRRVFLLGLAFRPAGNGSGNETGEKLTLNQLAYCFSEFYRITRGSISPWKYKALYPILLTRA